MHGTGITMSLYHIFIIAAVLVVAWLLATKFSPDPLLTKLVQIVLFLIAVYVVFFQVLPMAGLRL